MRPPCYSLLEEIVILEVIYGSLLWRVCNPAAPQGPRGIPGLSPAGGGAYLQDVKRKAFGYFLVHAEKVLGFMAVLLTTHGNATDHIMHVSLQSEHAKEMYRAAAPHFN